MNRLRAILKRLPDPVVRAGRTFLQAFLAIFVVALAGWLQDVIEWLEGGAPPDFSTLAAAALAAAVAGAVSVVTLAQNWLEERNPAADLRGRG